MKHINLKIPDETFYSLLELKAKYQTDDWNTLMTKIANNMKIVNESKIPYIWPDGAFRICTRSERDHSAFNELDSCMPSELDLLYSGIDGLVECTYVFSNIIRDNKKKDTGRYCIPK